ncbi:hypothetical protein Pla22_28900 [Rubripirellula amarantea]|uniref:Uncharacterized protein n=1 Tax=Rubripirellula amarantea TaxID=2527999 RepID=A0A5C5WHL4_9BACT|nr:hypothetical protein Pla22_28900 [Rubripirellula amarantea]
MVNGLVQGIRRYDRSIQIQTLLVTGIVKREGNMPPSCAFQMNVTHEFSECRSVVELRGEPVCIVDSQNKVVANVDDVGAACA